MLHVPEDELSSERDSSDAVNVPAEFMKQNIAPAKQTKAGFLSDSGQVRLWETQFAGSVKASPSIGSSATGALRCFLVSTGQKKFEYECQAMGPAGKEYC